MLPDLLNRVYSTKTKKRDETFYPTTRVDVDSDLKAQSFINQRRQPSASLNIQRNISTSQPAARYYDKKAIQSRIEARLAKGQASDSLVPGNPEMNFQKVNQIMQNQNINMKVVTDNISRNILVYTPKLDGKERFKSTTYPDSLRQIDIKIQKYKKALEEAIRQQQQLEKEGYYIDQNQLEQAPVQEENFDFLTGIGLHKNIEEVNESVEKLTEEKKDESVEQQQTEPQLNPYQYQFEQVRNAFSQIYEKYQNKISKAFIKKDQPKARIKRKNPKINITGKGNKVQKQGAPFDEVEHLMRIYNREHVPCEPLILVPSFQSKKDNIANTVLAYLNILEQNQGILRIHQVEFGQMKKNQFQKFFDVNSLSI